MILKKNRKKNEEIKEKLNEGEETIIAGDFNGHIGILYSTQEINKNGSLLNNFIEENNLVILNMEEECEGETTWEAMNQRKCMKDI